MRRLFLLAAPLLAAASCGAPPQGSARVEVDLPEQAKQLPGDAVASAELHGDGTLTLRLVRATAPLAPCRHLQSEVTIYVVSGEGTLALDHRTRPLRAGDLVVLPRNTPYAFAPAGRDAAVLLQTFAPPLQVDDTRPAELSN